MHAWPWPRTPWLVGRAESRRRRRVPRPWYGESVMGRQTLPDFWESSSTAKATRPLTGAERACSWAAADDARAFPRDGDDASIQASTCCTLPLLPSMDKWSPDEPCFRTPPKIKEAAGPAPVGCSAQEPAALLTAEPSSWHVWPGRGDGRSEPSRRPIEQGRGRTQRERTSRARPAACVRVRWKCNVTAAESRRLTCPTREPGGNNARHDAHVRDPTASGVPAPGGRRTRATGQRYQPTRLLAI